ncbi:NAD(P)-binding protein [Thozetella sp. PMI_491]|nr:NAD(P)-binding protein [Thozetella sp. PMI_491]
MPIPNLRNRKRAAPTPIFGTALRTTMSKFKLEDLPSLKGKVYIVTGGNTGCGKATVAGLALHGAKVYMGARSEEKAVAAIEDIRKGIPGADIHFLSMDLQHLDSVIKAAREFSRKETQLHGLVNNAGIMGVPFSLTDDGYEIQWQTNYLSHWLLTHHLLPILQATSKASDPGSVRIVCVTSNGHSAFAPKDGIQFDDINLEARHGMTRYGQSKLGNVLHVKQLQARYGPKGQQAVPGDLVVAAVHPGSINTQLNRQSTSIAPEFILRIVTPVMRCTGILHDEAKGGLSSLFAIASPEFTAANSGAYIVPFAKIAEPSAHALNVELGEKLWKWTSEQLGSEKLSLAN